MLLHSVIFAKIKGALLMNVNKLTEELKKIIPSENEQNIAFIKASMFKPELAEALDKYLDTGIITEFSFDGITLAMIIKKTGCNNIQAFFNMDELMRDAQYKDNFMNMSFGRK